MTHEADSEAAGIIEVLFFVRTSKASKALVVLATPLSHYRAADGALLVFDIANEHRPQICSGFGCFRRRILMQLSPTLEDSLNRTDGSTVCTSYMSVYILGRTYNL